MGNGLGKPHLRVALSFEIVINFLYEQDHLLEFNSKSKLATFWLGVILFMERYFWRVGFSNLKNLKYFVKIMYTKNCTACK